MSWWLLPGTIEALVLAGLALFLWVRRPPAPLWPVLFLCSTLALLWVLGDVGTLLATNLWEEQFSLSVCYTGGIWISAAWWTTAVHYADAHGALNRWLRSPWTLRIPVLLAAALWLLMITNPWHGAYVTPVVQGRNVYHWGSMVAANVGYFECVATSLLFLSLARRHRSSEVRRNSAILAAATLAPPVANLLYVMLPWRVPIDFAGAGLGVAGAFIVYGVYRTRLFTLLPVALPEVLRHDRNGVLLADREGRLLFWNPSARSILTTLDLAPDLELYPALSRELRHPGEEDPIGDAHRLYRALTREPQPPAGHLFAYGRGEQRWLRLSATPIPSRRARLAVLALRVEDVTELHRGERERRALEEQIRHGEKLKSLGVLAGGIAHDFNNLLTAILGNAGLAREDLRADSPVQLYLREIEETSERAAELTQQLLAYSGRARFSIEPVMLSTLVSDMMPLLGISISKRVRIKTRLDGKLPPIDADPAQIRQVVMNLVINGSEAIGDQAGSLTIRTDTIDVGGSRPHPEDPDAALAPGRYVRLVVSDSGCGMDAETRRRIFEPFFSTKAQGRGLGLSACFGIVRGHGGSITVESEPGRGSTFRVYFPRSLRDDAVESGRDEPGRAPSSAWRGSGTILVVDDERSIRRVARSILEGAGFEVVTAADGAEAVERFRAHRGPIRLVLLDLTMPKLSGEETLAELRRIDPEVRVLLSSGFDETDAMTRLAGAKLAGFTKKPYRAAELLDRVRRSL